MTTTAEKLRTLGDQLNETFLERKDAIQVMLLALLAGEHAFFLGLPGTAKSEMVRALTGAITGARYFECALSKTRPAEAVLGPLDIKDFRENGSYKLKIDGYLLTAHIAFIDEIGKMSPVLGHDLLAAVNERIRHEVNGGHSVHKIPLSSAFTASNEMLTDDSDDAAALWDRLLFRTVVEAIQDADNFKLLLTSDMARPTVEIPWEELEQVIATEVPNVTLSDGVVNAMAGLKGAMAREKMYPSDRRWRQCRKALKAQAYLAGRTQVLEVDLAILRFCLWDTLQQRERVERLCLQASNPYVEKIHKVGDMIGEIEAGIDERKDAALEPRAQYGREVKNKLITAHEELTTIVMEAGGTDIPGLEETRTKVRTVLHRALVECIDQSNDAADKLVEKYLGKA